MGQKAKKGKRRLVIQNWKKKLGNHQVNQGLTKNVQLIELGS